MNEDQSERAEGGSSQNLQLSKLLGAFWLSAGFLLLLCYFLTNYSMVFKNFNGLDVARMVFKDLESIKKLGDTSTFLLMVMVPMAYSGLGIFAIFKGVKAFQNTAMKAQWVFTIVAGTVMFLSLLGIFLIGEEASQVAFVSKFMPKPAGAYFFAFTLQILLFTSGLFTIWQEKK